MSKAASSPTARLLQSSRLFSLPRALPIQPELTTGVYRASETATTPYPTHQAITTPASSHSRGDWGLKRAIPNKRTKASQPVIRVRANDTYEHITDFAPAGDHVQTERKWTEMGVPLIQQASKKSRYSEEPELSVFEDWLDNTDPHTKVEIPNQELGIDAAPRQVQRWKYNGPWLGGMQDGEFDQWLQRNITRKGKKEEWRAFLRRKWKEKYMREAKARAREILEPMTGEQIAAMEESLHASNEQLATYEKQLRDEQYSRGLSSDLTALICEFLDLPGVYAGSAQPQFTPNAVLSQLTNSNDPTTEPGLPTTHPSAGLGHLRTDAMLHNHPLYGPQRSKPPVEARVVRTRARAGAVVEHMAKLGVGGVVANDAMTATSRNPDPRSTRDEDRMAHTFDENIYGGNRMWVSPQTAYIDSKSRIQLAVKRANPEDVAVRSGDKEKIAAIRESKTGRTVAYPFRRAATLL